MKKVFLIAIIAGIFIGQTQISAQIDSSRIREFGIGFSNFNNFNLEYQWGTPKTLFRISATSINLSSKPTSSSDTGNGQLTHRTQPISILVST